MKKWSSQVLVLSVIAGMALGSGCVNLATARQKSRSPRQGPVIMDQDSMPRFGGPNPNYHGGTPSALSRALASKDDHVVLAALHDELALSPQRLDLRAMQARVLDRLGRQDEAKAAYEKVLWPPDGVGSNQRSDVVLIERYLSLSENQGDAEGVQRAIELANHVISSRPDRPTHPLKRPNEIRAAIAFIAHRGAANAEHNDEALNLIKKAIDYDPNVAHYRWTLANMYLQSGQQLAHAPQTVPEAVSQWKQGIRAVEAGLRCKVCTPADKFQLDSLGYSLRSEIDMAKAGFFKHARKLEYTASSGFDPRH